MKGTMEGPTQQMNRAPAQQSDSGLGYGLSSSELLRWVGLGFLGYLLQKEEIGDQKTSPRRCLTIKMLGGILRHPVG